jgi:DNA polymerase-3 subunit delta
MSRAAPVSPVSLVLGDEEFLISQALDGIRSGVLAADPDAECYDFEAAAIDPVLVSQLLSPSLFGGRRLLVIRSAQDMPAEQVRSLLPMLLNPEPDTSVVIQHLGGAKGKAVLDIVRRVGPSETSCVKITRPDERQQFLIREVRGFGGQISARAAANLLAAVGTDLREISAAAGQLVSDTAGQIDEAAVLAYHRGRAEVTGFAIADQAVIGDVAAALTSLRWAINSGLAPVLIADALADGVRSVARAVGAGPGDPFTLAPALGMAPWKLKRARVQARGWSEDGLRHALAVVADLNAEVKGAAADPVYALEAAVRSVGSARG